MTLQSSLDRLKQRLKCGQSESSTAPSPVRTIPLQQAFYDFDLFPEYKTFTTMQWYYDKEKYSRNQFITHVGSSDATVNLDGREVINFSSYNYLSLAFDDRVRQAAKDAIDELGTSTGSGRSITGEVTLHQEFEREIAAVLGTEDAVVSVGGYSTNAFALGYLARQQDLIVYDELIHNSALAGCRLSGARRFSFPHNDYEALDQLLTRERSGYERVIILVEGVYSMDGDIPNLPRIIQIKHRHHALLMVDEAHSMGVIGPRGLGATDYFRIDGREIDIHYGSMSKAFGTCGGYVAGRKSLVAILKNYAPGVLLYGAAPTPANTAAGLQSLRIMQQEPERSARVRSNAAYFIQQAHAVGLDTGPSKDSGVIPVMMPDSEVALWLSIQLFDAGICTFPMLYPIVPRDKSRLRFFINTNHTQEQIDLTIRTLRQNLDRAPKSKGVF
ncbi:MAG: aminotransferase class I/II-fold pyridoxal phosphate-dependent enzyme [Planctomycetaceae bacterium]